MGTSPDELRAQIESTRQELAGDVDRLANKADPRRVVKRRTQRVRGAVTGIRERVMGSAGDAAQQGAGQVQYMQDRTQQAAQSAAQSAREGAGQAADKISSAASQAGETVKGAPQQAMRQTTGNPLAAGLIAFGAGALAASLLPSSQAEERAAGQLTERASDLVEPVKDAAMESAQRLREETTDSAKQAAQQVKETASDAARTTGEQAREQADQVKGQARSSGESVAGEARDQTRRSRQ